MDLIVDLGSSRGYVTRHLTSHSAKKVIAVDNAPALLDQCEMPPKEEEVETAKLCVDLDSPGCLSDFADESVCLVTSSLSLHWVNNLPGLFKEVNRVLKKDGAFVGAMFGGETLFELRSVDRSG